MVILEFMINIHVKLIAMGLLWASSYPLGRYLAVYDAPQVITAFRALVAFVILALVAHFRGQLKIKWTRQLAYQIILLGVCGFCIHNFLMFSALEHTHAGTGAVINGAIPVLVICADYLFFRHKVKRNAVIGIMLSFLGTIIVVTHGDLFGVFSKGVGLGEGLFLIAILGWTGYTIFGRAPLALYPALTITAYSCLAGGILMLPLVISDLPAVFRLLGDGKNILILTAQGILTMGVGFLWYYEGIQKLGPATASVYLNLVPVMGVVLALLILGEIPGVDLLVGGSLVVGGLLLASRNG